MCGMGGIDPSVLVFAGMMGWIPGSPAITAPSPMAASTAQYYVQPSAARWDEWDGSEWDVLG
jgi:hypothetical protein